MVKKLCQSMVGFTTRPLYPGERIPGALAGADILHRCGVLIG